MEAPVRSVSGKRFPCESQGRVGRTGCLDVENVRCREAMVELLCQGKDKLRSAG